MGIIFRQYTTPNSGPNTVKGAELTWQEGDGNFAYLLTLQNSASAGLNAWISSNSASFSGTASYALATQTAVSASYVRNAISASYFITTSVTSASLAQSASYVRQAVSASYFLTSSVTSASYALSASYVNFQTSSVTSASYSLTASYVDRAVSASYFLTSSVTSASYSLTASYTNQAATASYFITSSVTSASLAQTASYLSASSISVRDLIVTNTASIQYLNVTFQSSSIVYSSGSNIFGDAPNDTQTLNGQVNINNSASIQGNLVVSNGITGSLLGTASWAQNFLTSSVTSASLAQTASYFLTASVTSASYALTASYLFGSSVGSSSYSETASYALTASYFLTSSVTSASLAQTASYAILADTASLAITSSHAITSSYAIVFNVSGGFTASGLIYPTSDGPEKSFLQTDGLGNLTFEYVETIYEYIRNGESYQLDKGTPLYISGAQGANSIAYAADAGNPSKMPVIYIAGEKIDAGALGKGIALGRIDAVNTTGYPPGTDIYVAVGGGWTSVRPTGSAIIQLLGLVTKEGNASANGGKGVVLNPGPATLPNLNSGSIWVGDSNSYPVAIPTSSIIPEIVPSASFSATASYVLLQDMAMGPSYFSDALAAAAGVPIGGIYRNGNFIQIRIS